MKDAIAPLKILMSNSVKIEIRNRIGGRTNMKKKGNIFR